MISDTSLSGYTVCSLERQGKTQASIMSLQDKRVKYRRFRIMVICLFLLHKLLNTHENKLSHPEAYNLHRAERLRLFPLFPIVDS